MPNSYNSEFTGFHNDEYDSRITTLNNHITILEDSKANLSGARFTGQVYIGDLDSNTYTDFNVQRQGTNGDSQNLLLCDSANGTESHIWRVVNEDTTNATKIDLGNTYVNFNKQLKLPLGLVTGSQASSNSGSGIRINSDGGIEIYHASTPFIDFHYAASTDDYSARLLCDGANSFSIAPARLTTTYANSTSWHKVRDASFCSKTASSGGGAKGHFMLKSRSGSWTLADYNTEALYFVYCTDSNYNANSNSTIQARITSAGAFTNSSQRKYKENIKLVDYSCLDIINSIKICSFNMIGDPEKDYRVGFIADDTDPIVSGKNQDIMDLQNCIGVLIKAVQELDQKVKILENKIKALQE